MIENALRGLWPRLLLAGALAAALPAVSWAQRAPGAPPMAPSTRPAQTTASGTVFKCEGNRELLAEFTTRGTEFMAIVDAGDGPHALPIRPWTGGPAQITWSDGVRTLTWSPGVQIMWMDGAVHRSCGRGEHHH